jgi:RNA polymerase sigma factor (sigma-70 family)
MSREAVPLLLQQVRRLAAAAAPDDQILGDYLARHDEAAFAALVGRHGPMVLNVCRRVLRDAQAAEDVFQATFLVLAQRAVAIRRRASLASWLHGVAYRLAVRARRQRARRPRPAGDFSTYAGPATSEGLAWQEMLALLDEELRRLAERYRAPLVLCYLEGRTQDEAARALGWSLGTLRRRLEQGRELLQVRLRARGVTLSAALTGLLAAGTASVPASLHAAAVATAMNITTRGASGMPATATASNPGRILRISTSMKTLVALAVCGATLGLGLWAYGSANSANGPAAAPQAKPPAPAAGDGDAAFRLAREAVAACGADTPYRVLLALAVQEAKRGHVVEASRRFQQAVDQLAAMDDRGRVGALVILAYHLADAGDRAAAEIMVSEARQRIPKIPIASGRGDMQQFAVACLAEKIDTVKALDWAKEILDASWRQSALRNTAVAQAKAGDIAGARRTVGLMRWPDESAKLDSWQEIAAAQLRAGDKKAAEGTLRQALAVLEQIRKEESHGNNLWQEVQFLVNHAVAQGQTGDRAGAKATLARVEKLLEPGARAERLNLLHLLPRLADGQAKVGEREAALRTIERYSRVEKERHDEEPLLPASVHLALGNYDAAVRSAQHSTDYILIQTCLALAEAGRHQHAVALARGEKSEVSRALGLLAAADGALSRVPPERRPRYSGTFPLKLPAKSSAPPNAAEPAPTPQERMDAAIQKWEQAGANFSKDTDTCAGELLGLAREYPRDPVAYKALAWIIEVGHATPAAKEALTLLRQDHLASKKIGDVCEMAAFLVRQPEEVEQMLRAVVEKSAHRLPRGQASLALARFLHDAAKRVRFVQRQQTPEDIKGLEKMFSPEELQRLRAADPAALEKEAERLYERVAAEFPSLFPDRSTAPLGASARMALNEIRLLAVGKTAPEIDGEDLDGKPLRLSAHRGKVVVLTFWATWCGPCRAMVPQERALLERHSGRPFVLLGINGDSDRAKLRAWLDENPLPWRSWRDDRDAAERHGRIARAWNVSTWPTVYVLDPNGVIRYRDVFGKELDEAVETLLKESQRR